MLRYVIVVVLAVAAIVAVVPAVFAIAGCSSGPAKAVQASACREQGKAIIDSASSCREAVDALERLAVRSPECRAVLTDDGGAGTRCRDGGAE
jgi:hypothetical protein